MKRNKKEKRKTRGRPPRTRLSTRLKTARAVARRIVRERRESQNRMGRRRRRRRRNDFDCDTRRSMATQLDEVQDSRNVSSSDESFLFLFLGQVRLGQVRLGQVRLGQVRLGQVRLGQVRFGDVVSDVPFRKRRLRSFRGSAPGGGARRPGRGRCRRATWPGSGRDSALSSATSPPPRRGPGPALRPPNFLGFFVFVLKPFFPLFCKLIFFFDFIFPRISNCRYCYPSTLPTGQSWTTLITLDSFLSEAPKASTLMPSELMKRRCSLTVPNVVAWRC